MQVVRLNVSTIEDRLVMLYSVDATWIAQYQLISVQVLIRNNKASRYCSASMSTEYQIPD